MPSDKRVAETADCPNCARLVAMIESDEKKPAMMTSPLGPLPLNSTGLRRAVDEIVRLRDENAEQATYIRRLQTALGIKVDA